MVANELMNKYDSDEVLADVFIVDDFTVLVALKGSQPNDQVVDGVAVEYISTRYSVRDFDRFAAAAGLANPGVNEVVYDFLEPSMVLQTDDQYLKVDEIDRRSIPEDIKVSVEYAPTPTLDAAEGAMLSDGSGCTTGFRVKSGSPPIWRLTSANHGTCGSSWTSVNGIAMSLQGGVCGIDTSIASGSSLGLNIGGNAFGNVQGNPASGSLVYKYGAATGWTYGYRGATATSTISCAVGVYRFTGGNLASVGGDSGGPYISLVWTGSAYVYEARGTHRGSSNGYIVGVRMGNINAAGFTVG